VSGVPTNQPAQLTTGFARIDLADERLLTAGEGEPPAFETASGEIPAEARKLDDAGALASPLCASGPLAAAIQYLKDEGKEYATLRRWNKETGEPLPMLGSSGASSPFRGFRAIAAISWQARRRMAGNGISIRWLMERN
jgi:hypothetical protein